MYIATYVSKIGAKVFIRKAARKKILSTILYAMG